MITAHIRDLVLGAQGWIVVLHSGATINTQKMNLADAIESVQGYIHPQPEMSLEYDFTKPLYKIGA